METTTAIKSTITLFSRENSQLFFNVVTTISYALIAAMNKSLHAVLIRICTSGGDTLFYNCYNSIVARKILPMQSIFHLPEQAEVRRCQIWTMWWVW